MRMPDAACPMLDGFAGIAVIKGIGIGFVCYQSFSYSLEIVMLLWREGYTMRVPANGGFHRRNGHE